MAKKKGTPAMRAGAARVDVTPRMGTQIAGDIGRRRPAEILIDPLYAKVLVLESGGRKLCLVSLDLTYVAPDRVEAIRRAASKRFGFDPSAIMVHAVQNHASPTVGHFTLKGRRPQFPADIPWLHGGDDAYASFAVERIVEAIRLADESLQPARFGWASGVDGRVAHNRRCVMRDGSGRMLPPRCDPNILYVEGPTDPEVGVAVVTTESLRVPALLLHHTCHPVHGYPQRYITAGWPGAWAQAMRENLGPDCVPLVLNGCCGNVYHLNTVDPTYVDDPVRMGRILAETATNVMKNVRYPEDTTLAWKSRTIKLPMREIPAKDAEAARKLLAKHPTPIWKDEQHTSVDWDWMYAVDIVDMEDMRKTAPEYDYEVQALRIGDLAIVAVGGEPFVEGQLEIKRRSPARRTYVAHMSNGGRGYVPTPQALQRGGYETRTSHWSPYVPNALDMIVEASVDLLKQLF